MFQEFCAIYDADDRAYHTQQHIGECLGLFDDVASLADDPAALEFAVWMHDVVYDPRGKDNERLSADYARDSLRSFGVADALVATVDRLIMATLHTAAPSVLDEQLMVDIDLSILGADRERFDEYEQQIKREYAWVSDDIYAEKRSKILAGFLARPTVYSTLYFRDRFETAARENLARAIVELAQ